MENYYLLKDSTIVNKIQGSRMIRSLLGWFVVAIPKSLDFHFKEIVQKTYYPLDESVGSKGFLSFGEIRPYTKVLKQTFDTGDVAIQSEGIALGHDDSAEYPNSDITDSPTWYQGTVVSAEKVKIDMTDERTKAIMDAMVILAKAVIEEEYDIRFSKLNASCNLESASFEMQYEEAKKYSEDNTVDVPLLKALAESKDISLEEMSNKIISARNGYKQKLIDLLSNMNSLKTKFKTSTSVRDLNRLYEDYFGVCMPESQAMEEGRVVNFVRVVPVPVGLQF